MLFRMVVFALLLFACGGSGVIEITDAWAGSTPPGAETAAIYLSVANGTGSDDRLVGFASERCAAAELHATSIDDGDVMRMRPAAPEALTVPAGAELVMVPGTIHVMCIRPDADFVAGGTVPFTVTLESGTVLNGVASIENR